MKTYLVTSTSAKFMYDDLKKQLEDLYTSLLRYIQLKNDLGVNKDFREKYDREIRRCIASIEEIHSEFDPSEFPEMVEPPENIKKLIDKNTSNND